MAVINSKRVWIGALSGGVAWTIWSFVIVARLCRRIPRQLRAVGVAQRRPHAAFGLDAGPVGRRDPGDAGRGLALPRRLMAHRASPIASNSGSKSSAEPPSGSVASRRASTAEAERSRSWPMTLPTSQSRARGMPNMIHVLGIDSACDPSLPFNVSGNKAPGSFTLAGGIGADLTIAFEQVVGLKPCPPSLGSRPCSTR